MKYDCVDFK